MIPMRHSTWRWHIWPSGCAGTNGACEYVIAPYSGDEEISEEAPVDDNPVIIAENQTSVESLTVSEAVMRMDLEDSPALVFRNAKHGGMSVVFRRADGNIGWIDTPDGTDNGA